MGSWPSGAQVFCYPAVRPAEGVDFFMKITGHSLGGRCHPGLSWVFYPVIL